MPMPRTKGPIARVIALGLLLIVLGVALRGRLPGVQQAEPDRPTGGPAPLIGVIALVSAAMLVVAVAIVMSIREPGRPMPAARYDVPGGGAARGRRSWRVLLIGLAAILAWVLLNALLTQLPWLHAGDVPSPQTAPGPAPNGEVRPAPTGTSAGRSRRPRLLVSRREHRRPDGADTQRRGDCSGSQTPRRRPRRGRAPGARRRRRRAGVGIGVAGPGRRTRAG